MKSSFRAALVAASLVAAASAAMTAARAEVIRIAVVTADNPADFDNNAALLSDFAALMKKGPVKDLTAFADPSKLTTGTASVWASDADIKAVTDTPEWKAILSKQKAKSLTVGVYPVK